MRPVDRLGSTVRNRLLFWWATMHSSSIVKLLIGAGVLGMLTLLRPIRLIRIGVLHAESVGGFVAQVDLVLAIRARQHAPTARVGIDVFVLPRGRANACLVDGYKEVLLRAGNTKILDGESSRAARFFWLAARGFEFLAQRNPRLRRHYCGSPLWEGLDGCGFVEDGRPWIRVAPTAEDSGWHELERLGLHREQRIVCFGARDSFYWSRNLGRSNGGKLSDGGGHSQDFRNTDLSAHLVAVESLVRAGFTVVRMGAGAEPSPDLDALGVIDYANARERSDMLDLLLFANCEAAYFGGGFGMCQLALMFHKPVCVVDYRPFIFTEWSTDTCILVPSLLQEKATGRTLNLRQMVRLRYNSGQMYERLGVQFVPNSSAEILATVTELVGHLNDDVAVFNPDAQQEAFWDAVHRWRLPDAWYARPNGREVRQASHFDLSSLAVTPRRSRVGSYFLNQHFDDLFRDMEASADESWRASGI